MEGQQPPLLQEPLLAADAEDLMQRTVAVRQPCAGNLLGVPEKQIASANAARQQGLDVDCCSEALSSVVYTLALAALPSLAIAALASGSSRSSPLVENDAVVLGILLLTMGLVFNIEQQAARSSNQYTRKIFEVLPSILFCYFVPGLLATAHVFSTDTGLPNPNRRRHEACRCRAVSNGEPPTTICQLAPDGDNFCAAAALEASPVDDGHPGWPLCSGESGCLVVQSYQGSAIPSVAQDILLPACLVLLTLSIDLPGVMALGPQAVGVFLVAMCSIMLGGPLTVAFFRLIWPAVVEGDIVWRVLATVAGDWIGGGVNMLAMREIFNPCQPNGDEPPINPCDAQPQIAVDYDRLFGQVLTIDIFLSNVWLAIMIFIAKSRLKQMDAWLGGNPNFIRAMRDKLAGVAQARTRIASFVDLATMASVGLATTGAASLAAVYIVPFLERVAPWAKQVSLTSPFFWLVILVTIAGLLYSFTGLRELEGAGAARVGTVLLYILVCSIGMQMNIVDAFANPQILLVIVTWLLIHAVVLLAVAKLVRAPFFFVAVGSVANIGGAITAPIVAAAFDPALAVVGVLLGVLGYVLGTVCGFLSGLLMQASAPLGSVPT